MKFSIVYFLLMMFVEVEVEVEGLCEMFMFGITSEPCTGKFHGIFGKFLVMLCFACFHVLDNFMDCVEILLVYSITSSTQAKFPNIP